jgi:hypothetical protein
MSFDDAARSQSALWAERVKAYVKTGADMGTDENKDNFEGFLKKVLPTLTDESGSSDGFAQERDKTISCLA